MSDSKRQIRVAETTAVFRTTDTTAGARNNGTPPGGGRPKPEVAAPHSMRIGGTLHDPITGLANESLLTAVLRQAARGIGDRDAGPAVVVLQIDRILHVATCLGPGAQKQLIEAIAGRLRSLAPEGGLLARTCAHEFTYCLPSGGRDEADRLAAAADVALRRPLVVGDHPVLPAPRIGVAGWTTDVRDAADLLASGRLAANGTHGSGYAGATHFDPRLRDEAVERMRLEAELSLAAERHELRLQYQPIVSIETGEVNGFEALLRWEHPLHGTILPDEIIPLAEETGLIDPIGDWVLDEACRQMAEWQDAYAGARGLTLNVNLSARQLEQRDLVERVLAIQERHRLSPGTLRLELTESVVITNETALDRLRQLRERGIEIQLDDFGSGYSSLGYLGRLPVDSLKLDKTFLEQCETDARSATILDAIVALARELELNVTAEGIETRDQAERIRSLACDTGQGFFFHRPLAGDAVEQLLVT